MISIALVVVVTFGVSRVFEIISQGRQNTGALAARENIVNQIRQATSPRGLNASRSDGTTVNDMLKKCLNTDNMSNCNTAEVGLRLFLAGGANVVIAGPPANPVWYSTTGRWCGEFATAPAGCPIRATAWMSSVCPGAAAATCPRADLIRVRYEVAQAAAFPGGGSMTSAEGTIARNVPEVIYAGSPIGTSLPPLVGAGAGSATGTGSIGSIATAAAGISGSAASGY